MNNEVQAPAIDQATTAAPAVVEPSVDLSQGSAEPVALQDKPIVTAEAPQNMNDFLNSLGEEFKNSKSLQNFKDVNELAKSYLHAQSLIGKKVTDMSPEDVAYVDSLRGVPSDSAQYKLAEDVQGEAGEWFRDIASKAKLTQEQAKLVSDSYIELERAFAAKQNETRASLQKEWISNLQSEFGSAFNQQVEVAKRAVSTFGGDELKQILNESGLGSHPTVVKMFAKIGRNLLEDRLVKADHGATFGVTPDEARKMIDSKLSDPSFRDAYYKAVHPNHGAAVAEMSKLFELANSKKG